ncbi:carbon-nitrogen hydrolase family protein [Litoreibacter arenae]|uniref:Carbon-nitrogen hydrolase n=1 Tax=Litoreibacter arenae DSM 19593 TaxID=1123360 RepID=S9QCJ6_9RHOB|nr:carbon-nitrogen hydrolase family protein [Litoreibacter arenae]EPX77652.1 Carbon-nitrogen hydrolase [Litoreibacter arenae DSM 19593]
MRIALLQLNACDDPAANLPVTLKLVDEAVADGAEFVLTPEVTNCVSTSRSQQMNVLSHQDEDPTLAALRDAAAKHSIWLLIGSLGLKTDDPDGRFANRSFLVDPQGDIAALYDKIHMFDVQISESESYRESAGYRPGDRAVVADAGFAKVGLTICYDMRFPKLYRDLAQAGAQIITVPAAFSPVTGPAHWESLLRARAIETGCFVIAPAQTGEHKATKGKSRSTHGHSLVVSPWGEVILDAGTDPGMVCTDIDLGDVARARQRVPSLTHDRPYTL